MRVFILILFMSASFNASAQGYFEGGIQYEYEFKIKSGKADPTRLMKLLGNGSTLLFKDGNFRHNHDGGDIEFDIYNRRDNKLYEKKRNNDTIYWYDCSAGGKPIKELKLSTEKKVVLGISCNQLMIRYAEYKKVEYYNSDSIQVDPQWFVHYKRDDQYKVDAIEKSIFFRCEYDFPLITIISEATRINRETIDAKVFEVPANAILVKKD